MVKKYSKDFDPQPFQYKNTAEGDLPSLLESVRGQGLCASLPLDTRLCVSHS